MPVAGLIYALDLGQRCGRAFGLPGDKPSSATIVLKKPDQPRRIALSNLMAFLNEEWSADLPELVATEAPLPLQAFRKLGNAEHVVRLTYGLHGVVEGMCARFGIRHVEEYDSTIRKHFLGRGRLGSRDETKRAVVRRCQVLGLLDRTCVDEDRADSLAVHDWACATFGRKSVSTSELFFFGEDAGGRP